MLEEVAAFFSYDLLIYFRLFSRERWDHCPTGVADVSVVLFNLDGTFCPMEFGVSFASRTRLEVIEKKINVAFIVL